MGITIKEIASLTGTSVTAVSFVLNGKDAGLVSPPKQELIRKAIKKYGYKQNNLARGLQAQRTYHIAICVHGAFEDYPVLGNISTHDAISRLMRRFTERGYSTEWLQIHASTPAQQIVQLLTSAAVDGFLFVKWAPEQVRKILPAIRAKKLHVVCLNGELPKTLLSGCGFSLAKAVERGTQYLIDAGRKNIALLDFRGPKEHRPHRDGYLKAMRRNGRKPLIHAEAPDRRVDAAAQIAKKFIAAHPQVDGLMSPDNFYSMFVSQVIQGKKIQLVSFGDTCFAELQHPMMIHLSFPMRAMADWCAATLIERIEAPKPLPPVHKMFECDLIDA